LTCNLLLKQGFALNRSPEALKSDLVKILYQSVGPDSSGGGVSDKFTNTV